MHISMTESQRTSKGEEGEEAYLAQNENEYSSQRK